MATEAKSNNATTNNKNDGKLRITRWKKCSGDSLVECQRRMLAIKNEFLKVAKEMFGLEFPAYNTTDSGIWLPVPRGIVGGTTYYIGKVRLAAPGTMGGNWASIRVSYPGGIADAQYTLEGFIISIFDRLNFVDKNVYELQGTEIFNNNSKNWQPCSGDSLKQCIAAMEGVKDEFYKVAKEKCGYSPPTDYYPTDTGICILAAPKLGGANHFIGLVKLSKPGILGGYYASIRVSQSRGIMTQNPFTLRGFIISVKPWLQFVQQGVYRFGDAAKKGIQLAELEKKQDDNNNNNNGDGDNTKIARIGDGTMDYLPTGSIQSTMDAFKDEIKAMCGISGDLNTFQVVSATARSTIGVEYLQYICCSFIYLFAF